MKSPLVVWQLADGTPGHESQSRGLIEALRRRVPLEQHAINVAAMHGVFASWMLSRFAPGRGRPRPDLLIGCGSRTHLPLLAAQRAAGGRTVLLMRPGLPVAWFDLCIIPEHDQIAPQANVIITRGVLNAVTAAPPSSDRDRRGLFLIGGPSRHHGWEEVRLCHQIQAVLRRERQRHWTLTTSRRTPQDFLDALASRLGPEECARLTTIPADETPQGWVAEQLAAVSAAFVTEDSVSMVYESLTAGVAVGVLAMPRKGRSRVLVGLERLAADGLVTFCNDFLATGELPPPAGPLAEADRCADWIFDRLLAPATRSRAA
ncbi:MAG: mitochondrial fission ELM1 family protein [Planctomyces sp.]|nr:mitochondrial fission ELM1 family protein [Planctomyces sp.]